VVRYGEYERRRRGSAFFLTTLKNEENMVGGLFIVFDRMVVMPLWIFGDCNCIGRSLMLSI
jgi:hypothetical protein